MSYSGDLVARLWSYRQQEFAGKDHLFDRPVHTGQRPPVFLKNAETDNVLIDTQFDPSVRNQILSAIHPAKRHLWFRSMKSSQALVQSVFGTLKTLGMLRILTNVTSAESTRPFDFGGDEPVTEIEKGVTTLGELNGRVTEVDVYLSRRCRVAVECKLAEQGVGTCSRPRLDPQNPFYCDGNYTHQHGRKARCSLAEAGIQYWQFIPELFRWDSRADMEKCPLQCTYQLVRNVLAACVFDDRVDAKNGLAVLLYDARNPAFVRGKGFNAYETVRRALRNPQNLCRVTWQDVVTCMRREHRLDWLTTQIGHKYGL